MGTRRTILPTELRPVDHPHPHKPRSTRGGARETSHELGKVAKNLFDPKSISTTTLYSLYSLGNRKTPKKVTCSVLTDSHGEPFWVEESYRGISFLGKGRFDLRYRPVVTCLSFY